ncbi:hypothetical protein HMPREF9151_00036 [Hoylesella saccharolytica F0055]|uniref:Uncharacterized protein n=1 Tax=Hoylesella saccharolytica F0055 TaxID=1127699 RepID=L1NLU1_9BACT|nr:hypothetical protein HMPREF9151_00036 [Hoylesella saccharolytica F0055]
MINLQIFIHFYALPNRFSNDCCHLFFRKRQNDLVDRTLCSYEDKDKR